ncbi:MAG: RNA polymerase sigma24 factor [Phycisphaerae bacterium]
MKPTEHDSPGDQELIDRCNRGDPAAFEVLYHRYRDWVLRLAWRFTGDGDDALDCLQETFAYLLRKFPGFKLTAALSTFLYPVVRNTAIRIRQKRRRLASNEEVLTEAPAPQVLDGGDPGLADLSTVLNRLPDLHREVILMRFVDGLSLEEIATALSVPLGTVKSRLHHAISRLREDPLTRRYFEA